MNLDDDLDVPINDDNYIGGTEIKNPTLAKGANPIKKAVKTKRHSLKYKFEED